MRPAAVAAFVVLGSLAACSSDDGGPVAESSDPPTTSGSTSAAPGSDAATATSTAGASESGPETGSSGPAMDDCIDIVEPGERVFPCSGLDFDVMVPDGCLGAACGLIVDVHGFTMSAEMEDANTNMRALGRDNGFIVIQPSANPDPPAASWNPGTDDDKIFDFMMRAVAVYGVDEKRIHFTGFSQGGYMSWRFACDHADVLASVAPAAACGDGNSPDCEPTAPIPILYMHGTDDALVDYACAEPRRDAIVASFGAGPETVVAEGDMYRHTRHDGNTPVEFIRHDYAAEGNIIRGHCYPGSDDPGTAEGQLFSYACVGPNDFKWGEKAIEFFIANPKP